MQSLASPLVGIFVGGKATRMGGAAKGLLPAPDTGEPLVARLARIAREIGAEAALVGEAGPYARAVPQVRVIADDPLGVGPLGGLLGLLRAAQGRPAIALACDLPFASAVLLGRLAHAPSQAMVLAARGPSGFWEPLFARYDPARVAPHCEAALRSGVRSFQELFGSLEAEALSISPGEYSALRDWDSPADILGRP
jgi:molybdenum cofactor guanylyltransferase